MKPSALSLPSHLGDLPRAAAPAPAARRGSIGTSARYRAGIAPEIQHLQDPQWSTKFFVVSFLIHLFSPFSIPPAILIFGRPLLANMAFVGTHALFVTIIVNYLLHSCFLFCIAGVAYNNYYGKETHYYWPEFALLIFSHVARIVAISIKYAHVLSSPFWHERLTSRVLAASEASGLLLGNWLKPKSEDIERELNIAAERVGVRLDETVFFNAVDADDVMHRGSYRRAGPPIPPLAVNSQGPSLELKVVNIVGDGEVVEVVHPLGGVSSSATPGGVSMLPPTVSNSGGDGNKELHKRHVVQTGVSAADFLRMVIHKSAELDVPTRLAALCAVGLALFPTFYRIFGERVVRLSAIDTTLVVCTAIVVFVEFNAVLTFLLSSYADFQRRAMMMVSLDLVVSDNLRDHTAILLQQKHSLNATERFLRNLDLPLIDFTVPANVSTWITILEVSQLFGAEYKARIASNNTFTVLSLATTLIILIVQLIASPKSIGPVTIIYAVSTTFALGATILAMVQKGVEYNQQFGLQARDLLSIKTRLLRTAADLPQNILTHRRLHDSAHMIDVAIQTVQSEAHLNPSTIAGVSATPGSLRGLFGLLFSAAAFTIQLILRRSG